MATKASKKNKKPLQTTLGKAATQNDKEVDLSHVRKPIHTNIFGLHQVLSLFQTATKEVQNYIMNECDVMYECRICRTIFRSLANFILHKRNYCKEKYGPLSLRQVDHSESELISVVERGSKQEQEKESTTCNKQTTENEGGGLASIVQKLKDQQSVKEMTREILNEDLSQLPENNKEDKEEETVVDRKSSKELLLEEIATNNAAVFQTLLQSIPNNCVKPEYIKSEIMEIHGILDNDEAVLGPDGKVCNFTTKGNPVIPKHNLTCTECNMKFSTKKTLIYHVKYKHNNTRLVYVCPDCKDTFANAWCVYRHLYKIHRRTTSQIRRLREQIHNSVVRKDQEPSKKREKKEIDNVDEENQWLNNIEGDKDFQMCGGCGKRFERKAALHSHAQMCQKRIAVCNTIKENNAKRKEEETKDKIKNSKVDKPGNVEVMKGASKRKPYLLRTYKSLEGIESKTAISDDGKTNTKNICDENSNSEILNNCDISSKHTNDNSVLTNVEPFEESPPININRINEDSSNCENDRIPQKLRITSPENSDKTVLTDSRKPMKEREKEKINSQNTESVIRRLLVENGPGIIEAVSGNFVESDREDDCMPILSDSRLLPEEKLSISSMNDLMETTTTTSKHSPIKNESQIIGDNVVRVEDRPKNVVDEDSPKILRKIFGRSKRKRTLSFDVPEDDNKIVKLTNNNDFLRDKQDINFMRKAGPFMDQKNLSCISCKIKYSTLPKLLWHMSAHFSWFRFQCSRCSFISFSKSDCSIHARINHNINPNAISSVVLPIPNWKIALMSHEFCELEDKLDLSGRHTDENIVDCKEDPIEVDNTETPKNGDDIEFVGRLFADSDNVEIEVDDDDVLLPYPIIDKAYSIKQEIIDIVDEEKDSFQVDLPSEIYSPDIYETISIPDSCDERQNRCAEEPLFIDADDDLENDEYYVPKNIEIIKSPATELESAIEPISEINIESIVKEQIDYRDEVVVERKNSKSPTTEYEAIQQQFRPKRNRMRSVKTIQDDFVYDLNKVLKYNEALSSKSNGSKQKKLNSIQKTKVSLLPNSNSKDLKESLRNK